MKSKFISASLRRHYPHQVPRVRNIFLLSRLKPPQQTLFSKMNYGRQLMICQYILHPKGGGQGSALPFSHEKYSRKIS